MDALYFAFANASASPLPNLTKEDTTLTQLLEPLAARNYFRLVHDSFVTLESLANNIDNCKDNLVLFHFGGHASPEHLELLDTTASGKGIAALLGECPRLKLVVLNGCATVKHIQALQKLRIPLIIATHTPIPDLNATQFAISFYQSLAAFNTVEEAFNKARGFMLSLDGTLDIPRGLVLDEINENTLKDCWGLFGLPQQNHEGKWRLSNNASISVPADYQCNAALLDALLEALEPYDSQIADILQQEGEGQTISKIIKREKILVALPQPISEMVRKLLVESTDTSDIFFDQLGKNRLDQLCKVFFITQELMGFIMLAQLWELLSEKPDMKIQDHTRILLRQMLLSDAPQNTPLNYIALIRSIRVLLDQNQQAYFVDELAELKDLLEEDTPFSRAVLFFEDLASSKTEMSENQAALACVTAEEHLSKFMLYIGFVARYTLTSVKNIEVLKYRHQRTPQYLHRVFKLETRIGGLAEEKENRQHLLDSSSVVLLKKNATGSPQFLNLSPFIIDITAFEETKSKIPQLYFFECYLKSANQYAFRHIFKQDAATKVIVPKQTYQLIGAQFDAFAQLLFHQPMSNLS